MSTLERVSLLIQRNANTRIPRTVWSYEVPVVRAIHGEDAVVIVSRNRVKDAKFNADEAFDQLVRKYQGGDAERVLRSVYRDAGVLAREVNGSPTPRSEAA